jgi:predicted ribosomally synthesized peptide with SipW-like signal peptide
MSEKLKLSRRKMLAGLGTIGIASGAAGYGTYAAFNDEESQNTTFTAGELDLRVSYTASYNGVPAARDNDGTDEIELVEGNEGQLNLKIHDLKPGDVGSLNFEIETTANSNPAWILSQINIAESKDNGMTEPEKEDDNDPDSGELEENLMFIGFYDSDDTSEFFDDSEGGSYNFVENPDVPTSFYDNAQGEDGYEPRTLVDLATQDLQQGTNGAEAENTGEYRGAIVVDGKPDDTSDNTQNSQDTTDDGDLDPLGPGGDDTRANSVNFGYDWHLPFQTNNAPQGDTLEVEFKFIAIQDRFSGLPNNAAVFTNEGDGENSGKATTS